METSALGSAKITGKSEHCGFVRHVCIYIYIYPDGFAKDRGTKLRARAKTCVIWGW